MLLATIGIMAITAISPDASDPHERVAQAMILEHEGYREKPYRDHLGNLTVGVGHKIVKGEPKRTNLEHWRHDFGEAWKMGGLYTDDKNVRVVYTCMIFQLGLGGFLDFKKFRDAVNKRNWKIAVVEMKDSKWYEQTPKRVEVLEKYIKLNCK